MDDRNAIFNDCFSLGNGHAFLDRFALSSLEGGLVLRHERLVAVHPAFRRDDTISCVAIHILDVLQRVAELTVGLSGTPR